MISKVNSGAALMWQLVVAANVIRRELVKQCFGDCLYIGRKKQQLVD
jgi:hypothetical protein